MHHQKKKSIKDISLASSECDCDTNDSSSRCSSTSSGTSGSCISIRRDVRRIVNCKPFPPPPECNNIIQFYTIITPMTDLTTLNNNNSVGFTMARNNNQISLQWEPFSGRLTSNGVSFLTVLQSIQWLPQFTLTFPIYLSYKGVGRITTIVVNPSPPSPGGNIFFYLNTDQSSSGTAANDQISIPGGSVSWIIE